MIRSTRQRLRGDRGAAVNVRLAHCNQRCIDRVTGGIASENMMLLSDFGGVARTLNEIESAVRARIPSVGIMYLEPDLHDEGRPPPTT